MQRLVALVLPWFSTALEAQAPHPRTSIPTYQGAERQAEWELPESPTEGAQLRAARRLSSWSAYSQNRTLNARKMPVLGVNTARYTYMEESVASMYKYRRMTGVPPTMGKPIAKYSARFYTVRECRTFCDRHPACRAFVFDWGATRSCALLDSCLSSADSPPEDNPHSATYRTFFRSCAEPGTVPHMPPNGISTVEPLFLFVGVVTDPGSFLRRDSIRKAWMRSPDIGPGRPVEVRFFHGEPHPDLALALQKEARAHGDMEQLLVQGSHDRSTVRSLDLIRWAVLHRQAKFLMKLDDDTYPNFHKLMPILRHTPAKYVVLGNIFSCPPVLNITKWAGAPAAFDRPAQPNYAHGGGYILSYELAREIGKAMLPDEEAGAGLRIRQETLRSADLKQVVFKSVAARSTVHGCRTDDVLSMNLQSRQLPCMWEKEAAGASNVCCPETLIADYDSHAGGIAVGREEAQFVSADLQRVTPAVGPEGIPVDRLHVLLVRERTVGSMRLEQEGLMCHGV